jgi:hypothetical protein
MNLEQLTVGHISAGERAEVAAGQAISREIGLVRRAGLDRPDDRPGLNLSPCVARADRHGGEYDEDHGGGRSSARLQAAVWLSGTNR